MKWCVRKHADNENYKGMKAVHEGILVDDVKKYLTQITKWGNTTLGHMQVRAVIVIKRHLRSGVSGNMQTMRTMK